MLVRISNDTPEKFACLRRKSTAFRIATKAGDGLELLHAKLAGRGLCDLLEEVLNMIGLQVEG